MEFEHTREKLLQNPDFEKQVQAIIQLNLYSSKQFFEAYIANRNFYLHFQREKLDIAKLDQFILSDIAPLNFKGCPWTIRHFSSRGAMLITAEVYKEFCLESDSQLRHCDDDGRRFQRLGERIIRKSW